MEFSFSYAHTTVTSVLMTFLFRNVKNRIKVVPVLNQALRHEGVLGSGGIGPRSLHLGTSEWSASLPCRFTLLGRAPDTHCIGGWIDPRVHPSGRYGEVKMFTLTGLVCLRIGTGGELL
jgi:hypothetical protein